jgi:hypothetical protein
MAVLPSSRILRSAPAKSRAAIQTKGRRTTHTAAYEKENVSEEEMATVRFAPGVEPAFIRVNAGKTLNLGNYESLRIDVSVTLPCLPENIEETYEQAAEFAFTKMLDEEATWMGTKNVKTAKRR